MQVISVISLKGGVGKTITSINLAYSLVSEHGKKVLIIDNDKQGNSSKFFGLHSYDKKSMTDLLIDKEVDIHSVIQHTQYENLDIVTANMTLLNANRKIAMDINRPQQLILKPHLQKLANEYDYVVIDNAPDLDINITNALVATNDIIVPIKIDKFTFDGLGQLTEMFKEIREYFNPALNFAGCLVTMYARNKVNIDGTAWLRGNAEYPVFETLISRTVKIDESTFSGKPIVRHFRSCQAAKNYTEFTKEYLKKCVQHEHK